MKHMSGQETLTLALALDEIEKLWRIMDDSGSKLKLANYMKMLGISDFVIEELNKECPRWLKIYSELDSLQK